MQQFEKMSKNTEPEILRSSLSAVVLMLLAMKENPRTFNFMDKPEELVSGVIIFDEYSKSVASICLKNGKNTIVLVLACN